MIFSLSTVKNKMRRNADQAVCHWPSTSWDPAILFHLLSPDLCYLKLVSIPELAQHLGSYRDREWNAHWRGWEGSRSHINLHRGFSLCYVILGILTFFLSELWDVQAVITVLLSCKGRVQPMVQKDWLQFAFYPGHLIQPPQASVIMEIPLFTSQSCLVLKDKVWFLTA